MAWGQFAAVLTALGGVIGAVVAAFHRSSSRVDEVTTGRIDDLEIRVTTAERRWANADRKHQRCEQQLARLEGEIRVLRAQVQRS